MAGMPGAYWLVSLTTATSQVSRDFRSARKTSSCHCHFFLSFNHKLDVHRERRAALQPGLHGLDVCEHLPLSSVAPRA